MHHASLHVHVGIQGGKPSGTRVYCLSLRFSQSTLDDSGHNRGRPLPRVWAACCQLAPTQGCQELSRTRCGICVVVAMWFTSMSLLPQCTWAPTERHSSPVEVVLSGSEAALPGLVEIPKSPRWEMSLLTKANTINTLEGNRLQPRDALDMSQPTCIGHQPYMGAKGEPDR